MWEYTRALTRRMSPREEFRNPRARAGDRSVQPDVHAPACNILLTAPLSARKGVAIQREEWQLRRRYLWGARIHNRLSGAPVKRSETNVWLFNCALYKHELYFAERSFSSKTSALSRTAKDIPWLCEDFSPTKRRRLTVHRRRFFKLHTPLVNNKAIGYRQCATVYQRLAQHLLPGFL